MAATIAALLAERRGHFLMESGYHSGSWFELDALFDHPDVLRPFVSELAGRLALLGVEPVCARWPGGAKLAEMMAVALGAPHVVAERFATPTVNGLFPVRY